MTPSDLNKIYWNMPKACWNRIWSKQLLPKHGYTEHSTLCIVARYVTL